MLLSLPPGQENFSIGEVSQLTGVKPHVLRYWERSIGILRPARRGSGRRVFTRRDVEAIGRIRDMVENRHLTLAGAKKELRAQSRRGDVQTPLAFLESSAAVDVLKELKREMLDVLAQLRVSPSSAKSSSV
jgi:DNA-binding transcriptional MerR regulator